MLLRLLGLFGGGAAGGEAREPGRVPGAPVASKVGDQLAVDRRGGALEQARVLAMRDVQGGHHLVGRAALEVAHRPHGARAPLDGEQDLGHELGHLAPLDLLADRRAAVGDRVDAGPAVALGRGGEFVKEVAGWRRWLRSCILRWLTITWRRNARGLRIASPRRSLVHASVDGDLEQVAEGVASAGAAEPERARERHEQRGAKLAVAGEPGARVIEGVGPLPGSRVPPGVRDAERRAPRAGARASPQGAIGPWCPRLGARARGTERAGRLAIGQDGRARRGARAGSAGTSPCRGTLPRGHHNESTRCGQCRLHRYGCRNANGDPRCFLHSASARPSRGLRSRRSAMVAASVSRTDSRPLGRPRPPPPSALGGGPGLAAKRWPGAVRSRRARSAPSRPG